MESATATGKIGFETRRLMEISVKGGQSSIISTGIPNSKLPAGALIIDVIERRSKTQRSPEIQQKSS
jgi:hypothetical protein